MELIIDREPLTDEEMKKAYPAEYRKKIVRTSDRILQSLNAEISLAKRRLSNAEYQYDLDLRKGFLKNKGRLESAQKSVADLKCKVKDAEERKKAVLEKRKEILRSVRKETSDEDNKLVK